MTALLVVGENARCCMKIKNLFNSGVAILALSITSSQLHAQLEKPRSPLDESDKKNLEIFYKLLETCNEQPPNAEIRQSCTCEMDCEQIGQKLKNDEFEAVDKQLDELIAHPFFCGGGSYVYSNYVRWMHETREYDAAIIKWRKKTGSQHALAYSAAVTAKHYLKDPSAKDEHGFTKNSSDLAKGYIDEAFKINPSNPYALDFAVENAEATVDQILEAYEETIKNEPYSGRPFQSAYEGIENATDGGEDAQIQFLLSNAQKNIDSFDKFYTILKFLSSSLSDKKDTLRNNTLMHVEYEKAYTDLIQKWLKIWPESMYAHILICDHLDWLGQQDLREKIAREFIQLHPESAESHYLLGRVLASLYKADEAIEHFEKAIAINPKHKEANYRSGWAHFNAKRYEASISKFKLGILNLKKSDNFRLSQTYSKMASCYCNLKKYDKAEEYSFKALEHDADRYIKNHRVNLGEIYHYQGKNREAITEFKKAIELDKSNEKIIDKFHPDWESWR